MKLRSWVVVLVVGGLASVLLSTSAVEGAGAVYVKSMDVDISINNSYAVTRVREAVVNPAGSAASASFDFQIPEEAFLSNFSLRLDNRTYYGRVVPAGAARSSYDAAVSEGRNAGLLATRDRSRFTFSTSLKAGQEVELGLVYEQFLRMKGGAFEYSLRLENWMFGSVAPSLSISSSIAYSSPIESLSVENYTAGTAVVRPAAGPASTSYSVDGFMSRGNYVIRYSIARSAAAGSVTPFYDGSDTYFMHVFEPGLPELGGAPMPKQVVFVLDRSGSMSGQKIEQVRTAFAGILRQLRPDDSFNLVHFNHDVQAWSPSPVNASSGNIEAALEAISGLSASGSTNFNGALGSALDMMARQENSAAIIVMLTDGQPTYGVTSKDRIRSESRSKNVLGTQIFCLGFGNDVDFGFLSALSLESGARAQRIPVNADAALQIRDFFGTVADPRMNNVGFTYYPGAEAHLLGGKCLFDGSQLVVVGRMPGRPSALSVQANGTGRNGPAGFGSSYSLAELGQDPAVARFYRFARINELLDRITVEGPGSPLVGEATNLSVEAGFVTPYTSMIIDIREQGGVEPPAQNLLADGTAAPDRPRPASPCAKKALPYGSELIPLALLVVLAVAALRRRAK
jgi:uncharacterized protein YegL